MKQYNNTDLETERFNSPSPRTSRKSWDVLHTLTWVAIVIATVWVVLYGN